MGTSTIVAIVVVIVVLAAAALLVPPLLRRQRLRGRFGPEYNRAVEQHDSRAEAERELRDRERRHAELELRPLPAGARAAYAERWSSVQARFVDEPQGALDDADQLVTELMAERGYPVTDHEDRAAMLSVDHPRAIDSYRSAYDTRQRADGADATTEQLREAMVQYRTLFTELLGDSDDRSDGFDHDGSLSREESREAPQGTLAADTHADLTDDTGDTREERQARETREEQTRHISR